MGCFQTLKQKRYIFLMMGFSGFFTVYALRVNLSVAIVHMQTEYNWSPAMKGNILGSFFFGYLFTQLAGGWLATRFGGKIVFGVGVLLTSLLTLLTPIAAENVGLLISLRVLEGIFEAVTFPTMYAMFAKWVPPKEKTIFITFAQAGPAVGTMLSFPISGWLCASDLFGGWRSVFYVFGIFAVLWCILWFFVVSSDPNEHPTITTEEREYINTSILLEQNTETELVTPWKDIFLSIPMWTLCISSICINYGSYTLLTNMPSFFNDVLTFSISNGGLAASIPYFGAFVATIIAGVVVDKVRERKIMSTIAIRKIIVALSCSLTPLFLILAGFASSTQHILVVAYLSFAEATLGMSAAGHLANILDIAPRYAGILMGIINTFGTVSGIVGPVIAGILTPCGYCSTFDDYWKGPQLCPPSINGTIIIPSPGFTQCDVNTARKEWQEVFYVSGATMVLGGLIFLIFASGKIQYWNHPHIMRQRSKGNLSTSNDNINNDGTIIKKIDEIDCVDDEVRPLLSVSS